MKDQVLLIGGATPHMLEKLGGSFEVHKAWEIADMSEFLDANGPSIVGVSTYGADGIKAATIARLPNLKIISNYGVGYDAVDVAYAIERGIIVTHTPYVLNADVANTAIMLLLATTRRLIRDDRWVRNGDWKAKGNAALTDSIEGKKAGIVGMGRIGEAIARKLAAFDCPVAYHARSEKPGLPYRYYGDLVAMARDSDFLIVITPGGAATRKLVNRQVIEALGPKGTLVNVARGSVVDEAELVAALQDGRLGAAGLDVFEDEPNVPAALLSMDNVTLTPHVGSATKETRHAMSDLTAENLICFLRDGKALTPVPECRHMQPN